MAKQVFMQAYIYGGDPDYDICRDGSNFKHDKIFALVGNHAIQPHEKSYFEVTISSYSPIPSIKYIPIFVGLSKEPCTGVLSNDFIIGSIFYMKSTGKFEIRERNNHTGQFLSREPGAITAPTPIKDDVIGVGVDYDANTITIYRNGIKLYSLQSNSFSISGNDAFYPCVYYAVNNRDVKGYVNLGSYGCQFLPNGYNTIYQAHNVPELPEIDTTPPVIGIKKFDIKLQTSLSNGCNITDDVKFDLSTQYQGYLYSDHPYPNDYKIFTELYVRGGVLEPSILGIPISIGFIDYTAPLSDSLATYVTIPLWHKKQQQYQYTTSILGVKHTTLINNVLTSIPLQQGTYIGIGIDPINKTISIWVDRVLFYIYPIEFDFTHKNFYLYIKNDNVYKTTIHGTINFGDYIKTLPFINGKPNGYLSLSDYYRNGNLNKATNEIDCELEVTDKYFSKHKDIECIIEVQGEEYTYAGNGLNRLMDTYTVVNDREPHYTDPEYKDQKYLNDLISSKNNGFYPDNKNEISSDMFDIE